MSLLKTTRASSAAGQSAKLRRIGAMGSLKAARHGEHAPRKYASGGAVSTGPIEGGAAKPRMDRPGRSKMAKKGGDKGKGATVNIVIAGGAKPGGPPPMPMPPPDAGPPMPPPGPPPGGPPMPPMRAAGGKVPADAAGGRIANLGKYAHGGKVKRADGGRAGEKDVEVRQSASDRADAARKREGDAQDNMSGSAGRSAVSTGLGLGLRAVNKATKGMGSLAGRAFGKTLEYGSLGLGAVSGADAAGAFKRRNAARDELGEATKSAAGEERKRGGSVKK